MVGAHIKKVQFKPFGINIEFDDDNKITYKNEIIIAVSGPLTNLILAISATAIYKADPRYADLFFVILCNAGIFILNTLPIWPLDGGRALKNMLLIFLEVDSAERICNAVSLVMLVVIMACGAIVLHVTRYNFSLIIISLYLMISFFRRRFKTT